MPYYLTSSRQKNPHLVLITITLMARACRRSLRRFGKVNEPRELASRVRRRMALDEVDDRVGQTSPPTSSRPLPSQTGGLEQKAPNELSGKVRKHGLSAVQIISEPKRRNAARNGRVTGLLPGSVAHGTQTKLTTSYSTRP